MSFFVVRLITASGHNKLKIWFYHSNFYYLLDVFYIEEMLEALYV